MYETVKSLTWAGSPLGFLTIVSLLALCVLALVPRRSGGVRSAAIALAMLAAVQLVVFSSPPVADLLVRPLEHRARALAQGAPASGYTAILVLGGILRPPRAGTDEEPGFSSATDRLWHAAALYRAGLAPRIVTSGGTRAPADGAGSMPEAEAMKLVLVQLGVPARAITAEGHSFTTRENMANSARLLGTPARIALVTSAYHMPRALREATDAGLAAYAFPSGYSDPAGDAPGLQRYLPSPDALKASTTALKEWLGLLALAVRR